MGFKEGSSIGVEFSLETGIKVGDCMKTRVVMIQDDASVYDVAVRMKKEDVGSVVVFDSKNKKPYGIVTNDDIVRRAVAARKMSLTAKDVLSKPLIGIAPEADLTDAAKLMGTENIKRLVVFKGTKIVGIISSRDIVKISPSLYDLIAEKEKFR